MLAFDKVHKKHHTGSHAPSERAGILCGVVVFQKGSII